MRIDQNVINGRILQQRFQRSQSEYFVQDLARQAFPLPGAERGIEFRHELVDDFLHLHAGLDVFERGQLLQIDQVQQVAVQGRLQVLVGPRGDTHAARRRPASAQAGIGSKALSVSHMLPFNFLADYPNRPRHPREP